MTQSGAGSQFGPYRLIRLLGSGGNGEVYEAEDTAINRRVALKLLNSTYSQDPVFRERLFREARTAGRLREPHVLPIHSCGEIDGQIYIDMRLVRGEDLATVLKREHTLEPRRAVAIVRQIAAALDAAHAQHIVHRDVKPANILLTGADFASLVDFGLANAAGDARLTQPGSAAGTVNYMAPERFGQGPTDHRSDVYALACVLYACLTGAPPYAAQRTLPDLMAAHLHAPIPRPSQQRPELPAALDDVIARGLAKDPDQRYPTAGALAAAAQSAVSEPAAAGPPAQPPAAPAAPKGQGKRGRRALLAATALAVVGALAVTAGVLAVIHRAPWQHGHPGRPRPAADTPTTLPFPEMTNPSAVAVDNEGTVYVVELGEQNSEGKRKGGRVLKLAADETAPTELPFGELGGYGLAVDNDRNVYVASRTIRGGVWKLAPSGRGPRLLPLDPDDLDTPDGVAVGKDHSVYAVYGLEGQVLKLPPGASNPTRLMPTTRMRDPISIAVDTSDNVYLVEDEGDRGGRVLKLPVGANAPTELPFPRFNNPLRGGVAADNDGNVYVTSPVTRRVLKLAAGAATAGELRVPGLNYPRGIATDRNGDIYIVDCDDATLHGTDNCFHGRVLEIGAGSAGDHRGR